PYTTLFRSHLLGPDLVRHRAGDALGVPGEEYRRDSESLQGGDRLGGGLLEPVGEGDDPADLAVPADRDARASGVLSLGECRGGLAAERETFRLEELRAAGEDRVAVHGSAHPEPRGV